MIKAFFFFKLERDTGLKDLLARRNYLCVVLNLMKMEFELKDLPPMRTNGRCNGRNVFYDMECGMRQQ